MGESEYSSTWRGSFIQALFGRGLYTEPPVGGAHKKSIFIRHLDGGSSNITEMELMALENPIYDIAQYGIHFVASPRHADVLLITGPLTRSMEKAALAALHAMPAPRRVVTVGRGFDLDDGLFRDSYAVLTLPTELLAARVAHVPGDPPTPEEILDVLLKQV